MTSVRRKPCVLIVGATLFLAATGASAARGMDVGHVAATAPYAAHIAEAAQRFRVPGAWIEAVLRTESAGDARAVSRVGAMGLMQVMPATWAGLRARYGLGPDPFEPRDNILAGAAYLREMFDRYGDIGAMLAAYNAGPDRTDDYLAFGRPLPAETRAYVAAIAPVLGVAPLPGGGLPRASVTDWRAAPLFVVREGDGPEAASMPAADAGNGVRDATDAPAREIFVPRSAGGFRR